MKPLRLVFKNMRNLVVGLRNLSIGGFIFFAVLYYLFIAIAVGLIWGPSHVQFAVYLSMIPIFLPSLAVAVRRLHDIGKSGWWVIPINLLCFVLIGYIWLIIWFTQSSDPENNGY